MPSEESLRIGLARDQVILFALSPSRGLRMPLHAGGVASKESLVVRIQVQVEGIEAACESVLEHRARLVAATPRHECDGQVAAWHQLRLARVRALVRCNGLLPLAHDGVEVAQVARGDRVAGIARFPDAVRIDALED